MFDVITIGTATRDAFVKSKDFHVDKDAHVIGGKGLVMPLGAKLEVPEIYFSTGGGATNTAVTFARQGLKTACIAVVGNDVSGDTVIRELAHERVYADFIKKRNTPTAYSILLEPPSGERTILVYRGASESLDKNDISSAFSQTRWVYLSSLAGNIRLLRHIVDFAADNGVKIAYNPGGKELQQRRKLLPILRHIAILIANREEAALLTGASYKNEKEIFKKWNELSPGINVMTDARRGVWLSNGKNIYKAGIFKEKRVVDRTGAGDAFGSGFVAGIIQKPHDITRAIRLGSANATAKVEGMGAKYGLVTRREFEKGHRWAKLTIKTTRL